jgi:hypothetical protein
LVCVTPTDLAKDVEGGGTTIFTYGGAKTFDTTSTGSGILFRKDLEHEGVELKAGEKHIITANIWATRKQQSGQVLLVTFPTNAKIKTKAPSAVPRPLKAGTNGMLQYLSVSVQISLFSSSR